jgi:tagatose 1,6-diphosphate aldolase
MRTLSMGKIRGLQQTSTEYHAISVCALDHRNNLRQLLHPENPGAATVEEMSAFKVDLVRALAPVSSAVLVDPEWSAGQVAAAGALPGSTGLVVAVEATGYSGNPDARESRILPGWSVAKTKRMGASAVKLLAYYHPDASSAEYLENLVRQVADDCKRNDIPLYVEPLGFSLDPNKKKLDPDERRRVVIETARRLTPLGMDVLKAEFPLDVSAVTDEKEWRKACEELSQASVVPWVLLSAAVGIETYLRQVTVACQSGASGVAVGRAVWKEATEVSGQARLDFLNGEAKRRMQRTTALVNALARPWTDFFTAGAIGEDWYKEYSE